MARSAIHCALVCLAFFLPADSVSLRSTISFLRSLRFHQTLRVCNAYPSSAPLGVYKDGVQLTSEPLPYKACADFDELVEAGDAMDFKAEDVDVGTFTVTELPRANAVLLMVIRRHDDETTAAAFDSHVFTESDGSQVAVIDAYKGPAQADVRIQEEMGAMNVSEQLRFGSVVVVDPGLYKVSLNKKGNATGNTIVAAATLPAPAPTELVAESHQFYVILRCGLQGRDGADYSEELVVFPRSDAQDFANPKKSWFTALFGWFKTL
uniref:Uncharacterized protein n=1 Tax=Noctiluca scintillans TaxID=2966 RepID=A0A6T9HLF6_NOCSC|mmetsp:Transcript_64353/g.170464  ORF Transcript_64353/g.170464 Transcript_64353/m.170464 type:complete len:265 (+) Transcript_64353:46-840(+)